MTVLCDKVPKPEMYHASFSKRDDREQLPFSHRIPNLGHLIFLLRSCILFHDVDSNVASVLVSLFEGEKESLLTLNFVFLIAHVL